MTTSAADSVSPSLGYTSRVDPPTVWLVEADPALAETLSDLLGEASFRVEIVSTGKEALAALNTGTPDLLIVDVDLPDVSGRVLCAALRHRTSAPALVINAGHRSVRRESLWVAGADGYVADPSRLREIVARVRTLLRRSQLESTIPDEETLVAGPIRIDLTGRSVRVAGQPVRLAPKEFEILEVLVRAQGRIVSRQAIHDSVWGLSSSDRALQSVATHLTRLRKKLEAAGGIRCIVTVLGIGVRVAVPSDTTPEPADATARGSSTHTPAPARINGHPNLLTAGTLPSLKTVQKAPKVLLIDHDQSSGHLAENLTATGLSVHAVRASTAVLTTLDQFQPDVVVIDLPMPNTPGIELCKQLRSHSTVAIVLIAAYASELDTVVGLEVGADDVIATHNLGELDARIRAVVRRSSRPTQDSPGHGEHILEADDLQLDTQRHEVLLRGSLISLNPKEFALLEMLMSNAGHALTNSCLIDGLWGHRIRDMNVLHVHIRRLRALVEDHPNSPKRIATVRGIGYRFDSAQSGQDPASSPVRAIRASTPRPPNRPPSAAGGPRMADTITDTTWLTCRGYGPLRSRNSPSAGNEAPRTMRLTDCG